MYDLFTPLFLLLGRVWFVHPTGRRDEEGAEGVRSGAEACTGTATGNEILLRQVRPRELRQLQRSRAQGRRRRGLPQDLQPFCLGPQQVFCGRRGCKKTEGYLLLEEKARAERGLRVIRLLKCLIEIISGLQVIMDEICFMLTLSLGSLLCSLHT